MSPWSNIQISSQDPEIMQINNLQNNLGMLPQKINQIRELITRFEVCHFKYQRHLEKIKNSISNLHSDIVPSKIGTNHIQHGENAWRNDSTGRSFIGQQYLWAIRKWLGNDSQNEFHGHYNKKLGQQVQKRLGKKNPDKIRLVRLLLARLTWDWKSYEELKQDGEFKDIEYQVCRMDICHYAFPQNLNLLLWAIGKMKPVKKFEGCGSYNKSVKTYIEKQFSILNDILISMSEAESHNKHDLIKIWLVACLAKTLKEQIGLLHPIPKLVS
jgi:hypothetical protein